MRIRIASIDAGQSNRMKRKSEKHEAAFVLRKRKNSEIIEYYVIEMRFVKGIRGMRFLTKS